jgi:uncharacterized protein (DUF2237 family)
MLQTNKIVLFAFVLCYISVEAGEQMNLFKERLAVCGKSPITGYFRDGYCKTDSSDHGTHTVCAEVTKEFLQFSKSRGNDLMTPNPMYRFPGLKPGDSWCLCALRWKEAFLAGKAPSVKLEATNLKTLEYLDMQDLMRFDSLTTTHNTDSHQEL